MPISENTREEAQRLARRYPVARSALLPMLHLVQSDEGYVSEDGIALCAQVLGLTKAEVGAVATFYTMFKRQPVGDYLLSVCTNPTCKIAGAQDIYEAYVDKCGGGHHTDEGSGVTVEHAECLGICDAAPVVQINYEMYGPVSHDQAMELFEQAKAGSPPASNWSNEVPTDFRGVERQLSGIEDGTDDHLVEAARLQALAEVPPAYRTGETDLPVTHPGGDPFGHGGEAFRSQARLGDTSERPEQQVEQLSPTEAAKVDDIAQKQTGVAGELAEHLQSPRPETPSAQEQPSVAADGGSSKPAEAERDRAAAGSEQDPQDSVAGEAGAEEVDDPPTDKAPDNDPDVSGGEPTGSGDEDLRTYQGERRSDDDTPEEG
ncbi:NAD(P)H-dependent oxidoreductase subunit E [Egicoccus sp. AB-alg6-2]|uniref:NAD(P)H-dependent oxidoreductase subunit E n=1 Tax=Egicoccus sp. AB-alg6-2 TaxID=3242692 RepID=UPI00359D4F45